MIRMKGNETQVITINGENCPERTGDSYRVDRVTFPGFHVLYPLEVESGRTSKLIEIHPGQGPKGLDQGI